MGIIIGSQLVIQRPEAITSTISITPDEALELAILHDEIADQSEHEADQRLAQRRRARATELRAMAGLL